MRYVLSQGVLTAALEAGVSTFVFDAQARDTAQRWQSLARFRSLQLNDSGGLSDSATKDQASQAGDSGASNLQWPSMVAT